MDIFLNFRREYVWLPLYVGFYIWSTFLEKLFNLVSSVDCTSTLLGVWKLNQSDGSRTYYFQIIFVFKRDRVLYKYVL